MRITRLLVPEMPQLCSVGVHSLKGNFNGRPRLPPSSELMVVRRLPRNHPPPASLSANK